MVGAILYTMLKRVCPIAFRNFHIERDVPFQDFLNLEFLAQALVPSIFKIFAKKRPILEKL